MRGIETLLYRLLGNNAIIGRHIKRQFGFLATRVPASFKHRNMDDLGCGDGKVTVLLNNVFLPCSVKGFDVNPLLVKRARQKGIAAEVRDLERHFPHGDLAVVWGVLHHIKDRERFVDRLKENYSMAFIREPVKAGLPWLELGHPLSRGEVDSLIVKRLDCSDLLFCGDNILAFCDFNGSRSR
ncbi:MAG: class I SAM-dependent methyltransferase [Chloroflexota bacterium]